MTVAYIRQRHNADLLERKRGSLTARQNWALDWQRQGLKVRAIAEGLECSTSGAQKILARARRRLGLTRRQGYVPVVEDPQRSGSEKGNYVNKTPKNAQANA